MQIAMGQLFGPRARAIYALYKKSQHIWPVIIEVAPSRGERLPI